MPATTRTFRVFVSSTFSDLQSERSALQAQVFPRLRELAARHGCRFQAIDLRWGISAESSLDQQTMKICLDEIERCQKVSPRPNFIILLGDRFGWRPLPATIPASEFESLLPWTSPEMLERLVWQESQTEDARGWYRRDDNAEPPEYVLQPRRRGSRFEAYEVWADEVEHPLLNTLEQAARRAGLDESHLAKYTYSATGQEILRGALQSPNARQHVFGFFRAINNPQVAASDPLGQIYVEADPAMVHRQQTLKEQLKDSLPGHIHEFSARWQAGGVSTSHIGELPATLDECLQINTLEQTPTNLCATVWLRLSTVMLAEIVSLEAQDALEREQQAHRRFGSERARFFVGRSAELTLVEDFLNGTSLSPMVISAPAGAGKTALMARLDERTRQAGASVITRFTGASVLSSSLAPFLDNLCRQIFNQCGLAEQKQERIKLLNQKYRSKPDQVELDHIEREYELPTDLAALCQTWKRFLNLIPPTHPVIILLDAIDQLNDTHTSQAKNWLPRTLPEHVRLVISCLEGDNLVVVLGALPEATQLVVQPMSRDDGEMLLDGWLAESHRQLTPSQRSGLLSRFALSGGLPLFLRLAFEQARLWHSYDPETESEIHPVDIAGEVEAFLDQLEQNNRHGHMLVSRVLGCLAVARHGLSEDELLDILWADEDLRADFYARSPHSPRGVNALPAAVWARLYMDLEYYLAWHQGDGSELLGYYHRIMRQVVERRYCQAEHRVARQRQLADYFGDPGKPFWIDRGTMRPNLRKVAELIYQQTGSGMEEQAANNLLDYDFLSARMTGHGITELLGDFELLDCTARPALTALQSALRLSDQILVHHPDQLPSHLFARLEGLPEVELVHLLEQVRQQTHQPWLRAVRACLPFSPTEPPDRPRHDKSVTAIAMTPDSSRVICASSGKMSLWDAATGQKQADWSAHSSSIDGICPLPDSKRALTRSADKTVSLWKLDESRCMVTLSGNKNPVKDMQLTADGLRLVTRSEWMENHNEYFEIGGITEEIPIPQVVKVWDLAQAKSLFMMAAPSDFAKSMQLAPDGQHLIMRGELGNLGIYDLQRRKFKRLSPNQIISYDTLGLSADGRILVSYMYDTDSLRIWQLASGRCLKEIREVFGAERILLTPDARKAVLISSNDLNLWDLESGKRVYKIERGAHRASQVYLSPDATRLVTISLDGSLMVWQLESGQLLARFNSGASLEYLSMSWDGQSFAAADAQGFLYFLRLENSPASPPQVTAWQAPPTWRFWQSGTAFGCPHCRQWSTVVRSDLGKAAACPVCAQPVQLMPGCVQGDWHPVAQSWKGQQSLNKQVE